LHLATIVVLSRVVPPAAPPRATEIELSIISMPQSSAPDTAPPPAVTPPVAPPVATAPTPPPRRPRAERPRETTRPDQVPSQIAPAEIAVGPAEPEAVPQPSAAATPAPANKPLDLSPHRAAASMVDSLEMPSACTPRSGSNGTASCPPVDRGAMAKQMLDETLRQAVRPAYLARREPPQLHRQGDGTLRYDGRVFTARIGDDGHVEFVDGSSVSVDGLAKNGVGIAGRIDVNDMIERGMGKELYTAEKRWFLEQTEELREKLTAAARTKERAEARRMLERALERILLARELDVSHKRQRILALWEDCGDDAESADTRRIVEAFVRTRMPEGSDLGFSREELERFNRGRSGSLAFEPYRS
jgi:hypothetical protein